MRSGPGISSSPAILNTDTCITNTTILSHPVPVPVPVSVSVSHYLHQNSGNNLGLTTINQDEEHRIINVFDQQTLCRQMVDATGVQLSSDVWSSELLSAAAGGDGSSGDHHIRGSRNDTNGDSSMVEQLTEEERKLAEALVAVQFVQHSGRHPIISDFSHIAKVVSERVNAESSNALLEHSNKLYQTSIEDTVELRNSDLTDVPGLQSLSPLKKIPDSIWFNNKSNLQYYIRNPKSIDEIDNRSDLDIRHSIGGAKQQNRKILPHKKRIPKKLKKHTPNILQHISKDDVNEDDDNLLIDEVNDPSLSENGNHQSLVDASIQPDRALFICQICGEYYGNDQLQFFHHLKQHYEPHSTTIMIEGDINDLHHDTSPLGMDKIDDNMAENSQLPDALVELSLEQSDASTQSKLVIYDAEKSLFNAAEKSNLFSSLDKNHQLYDDDMKHESMLSNQLLNKGVLYTCEHCRKVFRKQKQYDLHLKEAHKVEIDDIGEFSEPEDLMEGIHVMVDVGDNEEFLQSDLSSQSGTILIQNSMTNQEYILPHLIIENGQLHEEHVPSNKNWYHREIEISERIVNNSDRLNINDNAVSSTDSNDMEVNAECISCPMCNEPLRSKKDYSKHAQQCHIQLKDEVLQQMMDKDVDIPKTENKPRNISKTEMTSIKEIALSSLKCPICDRQFKHKSSVTYHMLTHEGTRQNVCDECNKSFFSPGALKVHKRLHSGAKPHQCQHCDKRFRQWGDLKYHFTSLHSNQKIHKCDYCGKDFARKYSLILHRRIHTGEKNYQCEFCSKTFRASSYLQNHRRIHTGEKPHECEICGKKFRMKGDLRRHFGVHVKEKLKNEKANEEKKESENDFSTDISENSLGKLIIPKNEMKEEKHDTDDKDESSADVSEPSNSGNKNNCASSSNVDSGSESKLSSNNQMENPNSVCVWPVFIS